MLEEVEALGGKHLGVAYASAVAPTVVAGDPGQGTFRIGLSSHGVGDGTVGEGLVVGLEDFFGGDRGGCHYGGDRTETEGHEGAVELGHLGDGLMGTAA